MGALPGCAKLNAAFGDAGTDSEGSQATDAPSPSIDTGQPSDVDSDGGTTQGRTTLAETEPETSMTEETHEDTSGLPSTETGTPLCGDGMREGDEGCDDGNLDNADDCTTLCEPPTCDDGLRSGLETGVDCGGSACDACEPKFGCINGSKCPAGQLCDDKTNACRRPASCLEVLELNDGAESGGYEIDPLSDGSNLPVNCEMVMHGGGWTQVLQQSFGGGAVGWSPGATASCGPYDVLGWIGAGDEATRDLELLGIPHTEVWLATSFVMVDTWEAGEEVSFWVDDTEVASAAFPVGTVIEGDCSGPSDDSLVHQFGFSSHEGNVAELRVTTTLDDAIADESLGVSSISLFVR